jgi:hypothetical protein
MDSEKKGDENWRLGVGIYAICSSWNDARFSATTHMASSSILESGGRGDGGGPPSPIASFSLILSPGLTPFYDPPTLSLTTDFFFAFSGRV